MKKESIFKEYDIRGVYGKEINPKIMYDVGVAFSKYVKARNAKKVLIGIDTRKGSQKIAESLCKAIIESGIDVDYAGLVTGPMLYCMTSFLKYDFGLYVTASHNPKEYNGLKMVDRNAVPLFMSGELKKIASLYKKNVKLRKAKRRGVLRSISIENTYINNLIGKVKGLKHFKIVVDTSNGAASPYARKIFERLGQKVIGLNMVPEENFPGHEPNPMIDKAMIQCCMAVKKEKADLGIVFDGDADRLRVVDESGVPLRSDVLFGILANYEINRKKYGIYFGDLRITKAVEEIIKKKAIYKQMRVGNPFYKLALRKKNTVMAGELSGHIMYKEHFGVDDAFFAAIKLLLCMSHYGKLSNLRKPFEKYFYSGEINFKVKDKDATIKKVLQKYKNCKISRIDGITVASEDFWFNLRKSNTEPLVRLVIEAKNHNTLVKMKRELANIISFG